MIGRSLVSLARRFLPASVRSTIVQLQRRYRLQWPRTGNVEFAALRRLTPISAVFGFDRGLPIDRYYIECFLEQNSAKIRGQVLELGDATYTERFGGASVERSHVLDVSAQNPKATIVADLTSCDEISSEAFDCIIFTQSLQMMFDMPTALHNLYRLLKPGGTLLLTTHGISKIARRLGRDEWGEYWRLTEQGLDAILAANIPAAESELRVYGNVLAASAFLFGLSVEDLTTVELDYLDEDFEVVIAASVHKRLGV